MSIMRCTDCEAYVDTDDGTGLFDPRPGETGFWCESCVEEAMDNPVTFNPVMLALKIEDRGLFNMTMSEWYETQAELAFAEQESETEVKH